MTTGIIRPRAMARDGALKFYDGCQRCAVRITFDNRIRHGPSTIDGVIRATNVKLIAGRTSWWPAMVGAVAASL